jgi:hypothetical protein
LARASPDHISGCHPALCFCFVVIFGKPVSACARSYDQSRPIRGFIEALPATVKTALPAACPTAQTPLYVRPDDTGSWTSRPGIGTTGSRLQGVVLRRYQRVTVRIG